MSETTVHDGTAPGGAPRRGYAKGRAKREEILQAAIALFGEVGYHGASLREVAARVGISHPGLLHHFPTKAALLEAVLEHRDAVDFADVDTDLAQGRSLFEAIVRLVERNALRRPVVEVFAGLAAEATSADHPAHDFFAARYRDTVSRMRAELARLGDEGRLRDGVDPAVAARTLVALMDGLQVQWLYSLERPRAERVDMAADLRAYLDLILLDPPA
ncbi:TetR/AcrR family transcriptional regulator [Isoptericola sp. BMS4]|uniref:TetR/AcrR family transcriptional regulator n=1 Tax=Isoptericola sp. BMS4 TaxID=2527875 RepID=UPI001F100D88|nr:TetR/AcrR family transcriptional regulator [Isoptericola sp. BMS4]